jgi:hypothetical protein
MPPPPHFFGMPPPGMPPPYGMPPPMGMPPPPGMWGPRMGPPGEWARWERWGPRRGGGVPCHATTDSALGPVCVPPTLPLTRSLPPAPAQTPQACRRRGPMGAPSPWACRRRACRRRACRRRGCRRPACRRRRPLAWRRRRRPRSSPTAARRHPRRRSSSRPTAARRRPRRRSDDCNAGAALLEGVVWQGGVSGRVHPRPQRRAVGLLEQLQAFGKAAGRDPASQAPQPRRCPTSPRAPPRVPETP